MRCERRTRRSQQHAAGGQKRPPIQAAIAHQNPPKIGEDGV
jgi:hypothetical protein